MKKLIFAVLACLLLVGCYYRTTAPTYSYDPNQVESIREQLGAKTSAKEYINEEEEESEDQE